VRKIRKYAPVQNTAKSSGVTPVYFEGLADHDIIICDEKWLGLKGTGIMSDDSLSKINQTYESRMTPVCFDGLADHNIIICKRGL